MPRRIYVPMQFMPDPKVENILMTEDVANFFSADIAIKHTRSDNVIGKLARFCSVTLENL